MIMGLSLLRDSKITFKSIIKQFRHCLASYLGQNKLLLLVGLSLGFGQLIFQMGLTFEDQNQIKIK